MIPPVRGCRWRCVMVAGAERHGAGQEDVRTGVRREAAEEERQPVAGGHRAVLCQRWGGSGPAHHTGKRRQGGALKEDPPADLTLIRTFLVVWFVICSGTGPHPPFDQWD